MLSTTNTNISFSASCNDTTDAGMNAANFNASYSGDRIYFNIDVDVNADMDHVMDDFNQFKQHVLDTVVNL